MIAGVIAGLADYFEVDTTLSRILFVVFTVLTGIFPGIVTYLLMAVIMPIPGEGPVRTQKKVDNVANSVRSVADEIRNDIDLMDSSVKIRTIIGWLLIFFGAWYLAAQLFPNIILPTWGVVWPIILIIFGIYVVSRSR